MKKILLLKIPFIDPQLDYRFLLEITVSFINCIEI